MGVKLDVLRYKRLRVFKNRALGRIFVYLRTRRWQEIGKNCI